MIDKLIYKAKRVCRVTTYFVGYIIYIMIPIVISLLVYG